MTAPIYCFRFSIDTESMTLIQRLERDGDPEGTMSWDEAMDAYGKLFYLTNGMQRIQMVDPRNPSYKIQMTVGDSEADDPQSQLLDAIAIEGTKRLRDLVARNQRQIHPSKSDELPRDGIFGSLSGVDLITRDPQEDEE